MRRFFSAFFVSSLFAFGLFYLINGGKFNLISPIPRVYGANVSAEAELNSWFPKFTVSSPAKKALLPKLDLSSKSAILVDYDTGEVIYSKEPKARLPVASDVKIMTSLLVLEKAKLDDTFLVSDKAYHAGEDSMDLSPGEKLSVDDLLYGLILV
ncbi:MAG: hypothetical protein ACHQVK_01240, partial [Candidatus Paceibacterales bacterium]